ncbi:MAG: hypothetical protein HY360_23665 [Verrucomicrobia bacterium]|nr:hypothetical protein [Verrucomicrobiota bacterium]
MSNESSSTPPAWLPDLIGLDGSWERIRSRLYDIYTREIRRGLRFQGLPVIPDGRKSEDEFEDGFWHVTSRTLKKYNPKVRRMEVERIYDSKRSARLRWVVAIIQNATSPEVSVFESVDDKSGRLRTYLWLEEWGFVVILERRTLPKDPKPDYNFYHLVTAFCVDISGFQADLEKRRDAYAQKKQLPPKREQS